MDAPGDDRDPPPTPTPTPTPTPGPTGPQVPVVSSQPPDEGGQHSQDSHGGQGSQGSPGQGHVGRPQTPSADADNRARSSLRWAIPVIVVVALVAGAVAFFVARTRQPTEADGVAVELVAADDPGDAPFTEDVSDVSSADVAALATRADRLGSDAGRPSSKRARGAVAARSVQADRTVLFAQRVSAPACDTDQLIEALEADDAARRAWVTLMGVGDDEVAETVRALTPLVLAQDTAVTNSRYVRGRAERFPAVLQAGTAVLVDAKGTPRIKCSCGNPLTPARSTPYPATTGTAWPSFSPDRVVAIAPVATSMDEVATVDLQTGKQSRTPLGGDRRLTGFLVDDDDGVHVLGVDGGRTTVLDHPVSAVLDDGAGGLLFQLRRTGPNPYGCAECEMDPADPILGAPADADEAAIWHLPAGAPTPIRLIERPTPSSWLAVGDTGLIHGRRVLVYNVITFHAGAYDEEAYTASGHLRFLDDGTRTDLFPDESMWENTPGPYSVADGGVLDDQSYDTSWYRLIDPERPDDPERATVCGGEEGGVCPDAAALTDAGEVVGVRRDDSGQAETLEAMDAASGRVTASSPWPDEVAGIEWPQLDVSGRRVLITSTDPGGRSAAVVFDLDDGTRTRLDTTGRVRFLLAPLIRPAGP